MALARRSLVAVLVVLALLAAAAVAGRRPSGRARAAATDGARPPVPTLVELGSDTCQACRAMQPVLAELRTACAGRLTVEFIDVWAEPERAEPFRVLTIPTQVFLDASGREVGRHEGFIAAADVVARWRELGHDVGDVAPDGGPDVRTRLARALGEAEPLAFAAALVWGVLSIVLSPCHLASIPLVVAFFGGYGGGSGRTLRIATVFSLGILAAFAVAGGVAVAAGAMAGDLGPWPGRVLALVLAAFGLSLLGLLPIEWAAPRLDRFARGGVLAPLTLGFVFGLALGPCAFAFVAPLLAVAFSVAAERPGTAAALLGLFAAGHCAAIVAGAASLERVQRAVAWAGSRTGGALRSALGALLVAAAVWVTYTAA